MMNKKNILNATPLYCERSPHLMILSSTWEYDLTRWSREGDRLLILPRLPIIIYTVAPFAKCTPHHHLVSIRLLGCLSPTIPNEAWQTEWRSIDPSCYWCCVVKSSSASRFQILSLAKFKLRKATLPPKHSHVLYHQLVSSKITDAYCFLNIPTNSNCSSSKCHLCDLREGEKHFERDHP